MPPLAREALDPTKLALPYACSSPIRKLLTASHKYAPALPTFGASQLTMVGHNKKILWNRCSSPPHAQTHALGARATAIPRRLRRARLVPLPLSLANLCRVWALKL